MFDLQWLAFRADITRVVTFMLGRELNFRTYPEIGITEGHHGLSHHQDNPSRLRSTRSSARIRRELLRLVPREAAVDTPDGDGTLLDHSLFLYGAGLSNPNLTRTTICRSLVVGGAGGIEGGRHLVSDGETPMTNLLLTLLDKVGVPAETLGDSTGRTADRARLADV